MTTALATAAPKLRKLLLMLSSDQPGEVVGAAAAISRVLKDIGRDWHDLADAIAGNASHLPRTDWRDDLELCAKHVDQLGAKEENFIGNLRSTARWREPSDKQAKWLADIANRLREAA